ncbi:MAG: peptide-N-glycosidase, partial [Chitinophagaceae bacterium]
MKKYLLVLSFVSFFTSAIIAADTLHVTSHKEVTVVTDPSTGGKSYKSWVVFPSAGTSLRKINLNVIFGCPGNMRCADWDYLDRIYIRRKGGVNAPSLNYEIGHMLTPYGGAFARNWNFRWQVDITDFSLLLRDSVEIEYFHTGYEPNEDRGWKITVDFEVIKGSPIVLPIAIHRIYDGIFRYGDSTKSIETELKPVKFRANEKSERARIFVYHTG